MRGLAVALILSLALPLGAGCGGKDAKEAKDGKDSPKEGKDPKEAGGGGRSRGGGRSGVAFAVDVLPVVAEKIPYVVTAPGTIEAFERVLVTSRVSGVVDRLAFSEGQQVQKGDVLVVIDGERFHVALNSAQAALQKSEAAVRDTEAMVARREGVSLQNPGLIPGEEIETYRTKRLTAKADREVAAQAVKTAELNLRDSSVRAPIAGIIQTRTIETGQYVQPGYVMATLLRSEPLLLRFQVEPLEAPRLKPGLTATFTLRETLRKFSANITLVAGAADLATHMVGVTAQVVDEGHKYWLRPGSFCDVTVDVSAPREAPLIPRLAARATDHGYVAYVVNGEVARERVLTLGMSTRDGWVEVRKGLAAGDLLVVRGAEALSDNAKVRPTRVTPASLGKDGASRTDAAATADPGAAAPGEGRPRRQKEASAPAASGSPVAPGDGRPQEAGRAAPGDGRSQEAVRKPATPVAPAAPATPPAPAAPAAPAGAVPAGTAP